MKLKDYKPLLLIALNLLLTVWFLFGHVSQGRAQQDPDWTEPFNLSTSGLATNPVVELDANGTLHAFWLDAVDGYKYRQSRDGGITWSPTIKADVPFGKEDSALTVVATARGSIHLFWINSTGSLVYARTLPQELPNSEKWLATKVLDRAVSMYDVIEDSQGTLHIAYIHSATSEFISAGVYYRQSAFGGGNWGDAKQLYTSEYFRATKADTSFIRVAASNSLPDQRVYVTWDSRPQRRVFMAVSENSGLKWGEAQQIKGPDDTGSIDSPFNLNVAAVEDKVLLLWQVGEPGSDICSVYSQWSENNGKDWGDIVPVLSGRTNCPLSSRFVRQESGYIVAMMTGQDDPILVAWNGKQWSAPQGQVQLPTLSNPVTYEAVLLGCRFDLMTQDQLYVVGCDQGGGEDVWFISRSLEPVQNWFSLPRTWTQPVIISGQAETISSLSSATDPDGIVHTVWVESSMLNDGSERIAMRYAQWTGEQWTRPDTVITSFSDVPTEMSFMIDAKKRLLLSWVDEQKGEILVSWANLDGANLASQWQTPVAIPAPSNLIGSPEVVVDGSGRIVVVYAVPLNEDRGIYVAQSEDNSQSWSAPVRVFDAASASWERIDDPKISLSRDGALHLIFTRASVRPGQPVGLYYSRSTDGGFTWSEPQILSESEIQWSDIVSYDDHTVHVLWQEYDGLVFSNLSQVSEDAGVTWSRPFNITGVSDRATVVAVAPEGAGKLHFIQLLRNIQGITTQQDNLVLQDWSWNGSNWEFMSDRNVIIQGEGIKYAVTADIAARGLLLVSISAEYSDSKNDIQDEIQTFSRFLGEASAIQEPAAAILPIPLAAPAAIEILDNPPTQAADLSVLNDDTASHVSAQRNITGIVIIGIGMMVTALLLIRSRSASAKK